MDAFVIRTSHTSVGPFGVAGTEDASPGSTFPTNAIAHRRAAPLERSPTRQRNWRSTSGRRDEASTSHSATVEATDFQRDVWRALIAIPYGEVRTYAEVADIVGRPRASRAVGNANHVNRFPVDHSLSPSGQHERGSAATAAEKR